MRVTAGFVWGLSSTVFISAFVLGRRLRLSSDRLSLRPAVGLNRPSRRREFAQRKPVVPPRLPPAGCLARSAPDPSLFLNYAGAMSGSGHYTDSRYWRAFGTISPVGTLGTAFPRRSPAFTALFGLSGLNLDKWFAMLSMPVGWRRHISVKS